MDRTEKPSPVSRNGDAFGYNGRGEMVSAIVVT